MSDEKEQKYVQIILPIKSYDRLQAAVEAYNLPSMQKFIELAINYVDEKRPPLIIVPKEKK